MAVFHYSIVSVFFKGGGVIANLEGISEQVVKETVNRLRKLQATSLTTFQHLVALAHDKPLTEFQRYTLRRDWLDPVTDELPETTKAIVLAKIKGEGKAARVKSE